MFPHTSQSAEGITAYWGDVNSHVAQLSAQHPGQTTFYITSIEHRRTQMVGGRVFEADLKNTARRLADETHRLSTPEEIERYKQHQAQEVARLRDIEETRKNTMIMKPSPEQNAQMAQVVAAAVKAVLADKQDKPEDAKKNK